MPILGIGLDIVHLPRIASLVARRGSERLAKRILSHEEMKGWTGGEDTLQYLAVRFSVKEAGYKAMYPVCRPTWKELSYTSFGGTFPGSKPSLLYSPIVHLHNEKIGQIHVSVSHDGEYIAATVFIETP